MVEKRMMITRSQQRTHGSRLVEWDNPLPRHTGSQAKVEVESRAKVRWEAEIVLTHLPAQCQAQGTADTGTEIQ